MFRIRRIHDHTIPSNRLAVQQVQEILGGQFSALSEDDIAKLPEQLHDPLKYRFRTILFVAEARRKVIGFAAVNHVPDLGFSYLDYIAAALKTTGRGIGGALYQRVRDEARSLGSVGLFFECLPDDPALCRDPEVLKQNIARLRFYENYGARPIANTKYETPLKPEHDNPPYLVLDRLGHTELPSKRRARAIVRAILDRKYGTLCPQEYVNMVVRSFADDPLQLRPPRYVKREAPRPPGADPPPDTRIALVVTDAHEVHHVADRGYLEAPVRVGSILKELEKTALFDRVAPRRAADREITAVHNADYLSYLRKVCQQLGPQDLVYPYVFPVRNPARRPAHLVSRAGYYCMDAFTPISTSAYAAARRAVDCALTAADELLGGRRIAYALVRPPGHHAERRVFGGFCYFNNAAIAAQRLSRTGTVAILDLDYHHGNGQQDIFYARGDVLTISLHAHPRVAFPHFSGFEEEQGTGAGQGANLNLPLPAHCDAERYRGALQRALKRIEKFAPHFIVVPLGLDTAKNDPIGSWSLTPADFEQHGKMIGALGRPVLVTQEGGFDTRNLGRNARLFLTGLWTAERAGWIARQGKGRSSTGKPETQRTSTQGVPPSRR